MNGFTLIVLDSARELRTGDVVSFVGEDGSGSFGIQAHHAPLLTVLGFGLARYRLQDGPWHYLAMPGAVLRFAGNTLTLTTRRCIEGDDYRQLNRLLHETLAAEERELSGMRDQLHHLESSLLQRMRELGRGTRAAP